MKVFTLALLIGFISVFFLSMTPLSHGFETKHLSVDCIFAAQHESYCPQGVIDHIAAWKSVFMNMLPVASVVLVLGAVLIMQTTAPFLQRRWLLHKIPIATFMQQQRLRLYGFDYRAWQDLFSRGILNPKLFNFLNKNHIFY